MQTILAALKGELRITDTQTKQWDAFTLSVIEAQKADAAAAFKPNASNSLGVLDIMQAHEAFLKARLTGLDAILGSFKPLYDVLTPEQKLAADRIMPQRLGAVM